MTDREKLVKLLYEPFLQYKINELSDAGDIADHLLANGVVVQECCHKAESVISKTGLMCTACHSDIDRDAVFCKYCGAKVMPQPTVEQAME